MDRAYRAWLASPSSQFKIGADQLTGTGFSQYAGIATASDGTEHPAAIDGRHPLISPR